MHDLMIPSCILFVFYMDVPNHCGKFITIIYKTSQDVIFFHSKKKTSSDKKKVVLSLIQVVCKLLSFK